MDKGKFTRVALRHLRNAPHRIRCERHLNTLPLRCVPSASHFHRATLC